VRQTVIERASQLADAFQQTYNALAAKPPQRTSRLARRWKQINKKVAELQKLQPHRAARQQDR
jgi:CHASE3 domain sensor protein